VTEHVAPQARGREPINLPCDALRASVFPVKPTTHEIKLCSLGGSAQTGVFYALHLPAVSSKCFSAPVFVASVSDLQT
jgi:hypothetical protein